MQGAAGRLDLKRHLTVTWLLLEQVECNAECDKTWAVLRGVPVHPERVTAILANWTAGKLARGGLGFVCASDDAMRAPVSLAGPGLLESESAMIDPHRY